MCLKSHPIKKKVSILLVNIYFKIKVHKIVLSVTLALI